MSWEGGLIGRFVDWGSAGDELSRVIKLASSTAAAIEMFGCDRSDLGFTAGAGLWS